MIFFIFYDLFGWLRVTKNETANTPRQEIPKEAMQSFFLQSTPSLMKFILAYAIGLWLQYYLTSLRIFQ